MGPIAPDSRNCSNLGQSHVTKRRLNQIPDIHFEYLFEEDGDAEVSHGKYEVLQKIELPGRHTPKVA